MVDKSRTPATTLRRARQIALDAGMHHVYVGNVHDKEADSTYCPSCKNLVIGRDWYELSEWHLTHEGFCLHCNTPMAGVFRGPPGTWGRKRQRVWLQDYS